MNLVKHLFNIEGLLVRVQLGEQNDQVEAIFYLVFYAKTRALHTYYTLNKTNRNQFPRKNLTTPQKQALQGEVSRQWPSCCRERGFEGMPPWFCFFASGCVCCVVGSVNMVSRVGCVCCGAGRVGCVFYVGGGVYFLVVRGVWLLCRGCGVWLLCRGCVLGIVLVVWLVVWA